jgi:hypothetical protein
MDKKVSAEFVLNFIDSLPVKPYASNNFDQDGLFAIDKYEAIKQKHLQVNQKGLVRHLLFDLDHKKIFIWKDLGLPQPSWQSVNPLNGHSHIAYTLKAPVCISLKGRHKPKAYLEDIRLKICGGLCGDINYRGVTTKNPLHEYWNVIIGDCHEYELRDLAEICKDFKKPKKIIRGEITGSRNCYLFDAGRYWAYLNVDEYSDSGIFREAVLNHLMSLNTFSPELGFNEVQAIAKSIAAWTWKNFQRYNKRFRQRQSRRGQLSGEARLLKSEQKRNEAVFLHNECHMSLTETAKHLKMSRRTIAYWTAKL